MSFNSSAFALFLIVVGVLYALLQLRRDFRSQNFLLLVASYIFYGAWDIRFLFLVFASTAVDYIAGLGIKHQKAPINSLVWMIAGLLVFGSIAILPELGWNGTGDNQVIGSTARASQVSRKGQSAFVAVAGSLAIILLMFYAGFKSKRIGTPLYFLMLSVFSNLGMLAVFKYYDFFIESANYAMSGLGVSSHLSTLNLILPVGISFYTFQTMSYAIDIYRGKLRPTSDFIEFAVFVSYFPQLVAGPIERATDLLPHFQRPRTIEAFDIQTGFFLVSWGLYKKIFVADNLSPIVTNAFGQPSPSGPLVWVGVFAFAMQIYCDFSAYSDIARGISRMLGIELSINFNSPYFVSNPQDFWKRWHISLSSWLRDYLYIPLGGSKGSDIVIYRNLMLTMLIGGLWHGARGNFILWGGYQGLLLCVHRFLFRSYGKRPSAETAATEFGILNQVWGLARWFVFFQLVLYGWLLFRAESVQQVVRLTGSLGSNWGSVLEYFPLLFKILWFTWLTWLVDYRSFRLKNQLHIMSSPVAIRVAFYLWIFYSITIFGAHDEVDFIYFQF